MPSLQAYRSELPYSYAPGVFPSMECMMNRPQQARRLLIHSQSGENQGVQRLQALCGERHVRAEVADKALARVSGKENCFAAVVFEKFQGCLRADVPHVVLHQPSDGGNLGTILRTCLGLGVTDVAVIRPAADVFDPRVIRASMGAIFSMEVMAYDSFQAYREQYPLHALYPFMLDGASPLEDAAGRPETPFALVFGNEGRGLPPAFAGMGKAVRIPHNAKIDSLNLSVAASIGIYAFMRGQQGGAPHD